MQTFATVQAKSKDSSVQSTSRRPDNLGMGGLSDESRSSPLNGGAPISVPSIPFQDAFQQVANEKDIVIGLREPNALGAPLLVEGYSSKGFHIKAKSSVSGPTAGFVAADPALGKLGEAGKEKQRAYIDAALKQGAGKVPLRLSDTRVKDLTDRGLIHWINAHSISAKYGNTTHYFEMKREPGSSELPWAMFHDSGKPVEILSNPERLGGPRGPKAAVTADYDLFSLFPRGNRSNNVRPMNPVARVVGQPKPSVLKRANAYLSRMRETNRTMDADLGNFHYYGETIKNALNLRITQEGYRGGLLVHHGDETSNPFSPGQDFPVRFIVPRHRAMLVKNDQQLLNAYQLFMQLGYGVEINPAFSFPSWAR
jgi:insecticidal toxin complex protein TccC